MYSDFNYNTNINQDIFNKYLGLGVGIIISCLIIFLLIEIILIIANWRIFKKARKEGWEAIVPFYNKYILFEIAGYPGYYMFFSFIPYAGVIINFIFNILISISINKKFHKNSAFALVLIFFPYIGYPYLAFSKSTFDKNENNNENVVSEQNIDEEYEYKYCGKCGIKVRKDETICPNCKNKL